jgi:PilZ domain
LSDLSETGCRVQSRHPLKIGTSLALVAELPHPVLITEARVVWVTGRWNGLEFLRVSPTERTRLRHFLWRHISRAMVTDHPPLFTLVSSSHQNRKGLKAIS